MSNLWDKYEGKCPVRHHDLYNFQHKIMSEALKEQSPVQTLLDEIDENSDILSEMLVEDDQLTHLLLVHQKSLKIICHNHDILLMDCTYKTNQYQMPLLNILGVTYMHTTINLGFVFMNHEKEFDYT